MQPAQDYCGDQFFQLVLGVLAGLRFSRCNSLVKVLDELVKG